MLVSYDENFHLFSLLKVAVETAVNMNDPAVIVDLLGVIVFRP